MIKSNERDWEIAARACREVAELPDRDTCEHMTPDDMLVTSDELAPIIAAAAAEARQQAIEECAPRWRPIDTAPERGSYIVANKLRQVCHCRAEAGERIISNMPGCAEWDYPEAATHWIPLPSAPGSEERGR